MFVLLQNCMRKVIIDSVLSLLGFNWFSLYVPT